MQRNELRFGITVLQLNSMQASATCSRTSGDLSLQKQLSISSKTAIAFPETAQLNLETAVGCIALSPQR